MSVALRRPSPHSISAGMVSVLKEPGGLVMLSEWIRWDHRRTVTSSDHVCHPSKTLTTLNLDSNRVGTKGASWLDSALRVNRVSSQSKSGEIVDGPSRRLTMSVTLRRHSPHSISAGMVSVLKEPGGLIMLSEWIRWDHRRTVTSSDHVCHASKTLTTLNLDSNRLGTKGASWLDSALRVNRWAHRWTVTSFDDVCHPSKTLTTLDLRGNAIGAKVAKWLDNALRVNQVRSSKDSHVVWPCLSRFEDTHHTRSPISEWYRC